MYQPDPAPPPPQSASFAGCALFGIGMLMLIPSGLCTAIGGVGLVAQLFTDPSELVRDFDDYAPFVAITLVPLALGVLLVWASIRVRKR